MGRNGRSRADGVFSLCRGKPEATKEHPDLFGYMGTGSDLVLPTGMGQHGERESGVGGLVFRGRYRRRCIWSAAALETVNQFLEEAEKASD